LENQEEANSKISATHFTDTPSANIKLFKIYKFPSCFSYYELRCIKSINFSIPFQERLINNCLRKTLFFDKFIKHFYSKKKIKFPTFTKDIFNEILIKALKTTLERLKKNQDTREEGQK
jgi:hypothetical protein